MIPTLGIDKRFHGKPEDPEWRYSTQMEPLAAERAASASDNAAAADGAVNHEVQTEWTDALDDDLLDTLTRFGAGRSQPAIGGVSIFLLWGPVSTRYYRVRFFRRAQNS